jgi:uncharacterized protein
MRRILLVSDTHGLLRPELERLLQQDWRLIVHAGDIGERTLLERLARNVEVLAVRGNNDRGAWAERLPLQARVEVEGLGLHLVHDIAALDPAPLRAGDVVVSGHSHQPRIERRDGLLFVNPGSAGRRRFRLPVTVAELQVGDGHAEAQVIHLLP